MSEIVHCDHCTELERRIGELHGSVTSLQHNLDRTDDRVRSLDAVVRNGLSHRVERIDKKVVDIELTMTSFGSTLSQIAERADQIFSRQKRSSVTLVVANHLWAYRKAYLIFGLPPMAAIAVWAGWTDIKAIASVLKSVGVIPGAK